MKQRVKITSVEFATHNVLRITTEKPAGLSYTPGQATEIFLDREEWAGAGRPFTFTSLAAAPNLEFTIKTYPERHGMTEQLLSLRAGDTLILNDVFGDIAYKGEGVFIAGGAGVTPFIAILRDLGQRQMIGGNQLIFANKTKADIINEKEFRTQLGPRFINILSAEREPGCAYGQITAEFLRPYFQAADNYAYLCGPPLMMESVERSLRALGVPSERIVKESF